MDQDQRTRIVQRLIAKAWMDQDFKKRLFAEPATVMAEEGLEVPDGVEIRVKEDTDKVRHFVLPAKPDNPDMESVDERLAAYVFII